MENEREKLLIEEILGDARKRAERVKKEAKRRATTLIDQARKDADTEKQKIIEQATKNAQLEYNKIVSTVDVERIRRELKTKEEVLQAAFARAETQISQLDPEQYAEEVVALSLPAIRLVATEEMVVVVGCKYHNLELNRIEEAMCNRSESGEARFRLELSSDTSFVGVKVFSKDGRLCFDNSIEGRRKRLGTMLRDGAAKNLFNS